MLYNAIVRKFNRQEDPPYQVVGKVLLQNPNQVPASWNIRYRGRVLPRGSDFDSIMCSSKEPLQLFPPNIGGTGDSEMIPIRIRTLTGKCIQFMVSPYDTTEMIKEQIQGAVDVLPIDQRLISAGMQLEDGKTLQDYFISKHSTLHLVRRLCGGGFSTVDLEARQLSGRGVPTTQRWKGYTLGLNLYGSCPIPTCISNTMKSDVVFQAKYGIIRMTSSNNKFECPACKLAPESNGSGSTSDIGAVSRKVGTFCPKNFLVCYGRCIFRYKKSGMDQPVHLMEMESLGCNYEYKMFDESEGVAEYDFLEIITLGPGSSPYYCAGCGDSCGTKSFDGATIFSCGHAYHERCSPMTAEQCFVCEAKLLGSLEDLEGFEPNGELVIDPGTPPNSSRWSNEDEAAYLEISNTESHHNLNRMRWEQKQLVAKE